MALLDLGLVTRTFLTLLEERLPLYPDWPAATAVTVQPAPPDAITAGSHSLSFYLYHVREDAHTKAQDCQTDDSRPRRSRASDRWRVRLIGHNVVAAETSAAALARRLGLPTLGVDADTLPQIDAYERAVRSNARHISIAAPPAGVYGGERSPGLGRSCPSQCSS